MWTVVNRVVVKIVSEHFAALFRHTLRRTINARSNGYCGHERRPIGRCVEIPGPIGINKRHWRMKAQPTPALRASFEGNVHRVKPVDGNLAACDFDSDVFAESI